jgi:PAS domain S-box-containing protein
MSDADPEDQRLTLTADALQAAIFNSANFSSIATDAGGVIQIFNVGAERMLGFSASDVVNKITPADISDPTELVVRARALSAEFSRPIAPGFEALVFKASRGLEDIYELTYIKKDGTRLPAEVSVTALRDAAENIIGYLLVGTDNTERQAVEAERLRLDQSLRDQQFYTRSLIESNVDALLTTNPQGIIRDVNQQMELLTGCTRDELIGAPFKDFFADPELAEATIKKVLEVRKVTDHELTALSRDGTEAVASYNLTTYYDRNRRLQGVFATARDVTERRRLDQILKERNLELSAARITADKANQAKSDFLASMSHELRSPLNAILGFAQLMESESPAPTPAQHDSISQILQAGWHLLKLINEILDLAKIESGQFSLSLESVSLGDVMAECQSIIEGQARAQGIALSFPIFEAPCFVRADRTRLKQVIINLMTNAIKYNQPNGRVDVTFEENASARVRICISDTGVGLSPQRLGQLFQPFNRLGQEGGGVEGTGIGLVVAKQLIELMNGVVGVESTVDVGSDFWFEVASASPPAFVAGTDLVPLVPLSPEPSGERQRQFLYVEDNSANLKLVERLFARHSGWKLTGAMTGRLGVELAHSMLPDVILMDINLPDISGDDALVLLRKSPVTRHIPVVAVTANAMPRGIERGLKSGFFQYVTKPINVGEFMKTLTAALAFVDRHTTSSSTAGEAH